MPSYQNFRLWKWKELSHRRVFYLVLLQFMLTFLWLTVYYAVGESSYFTDKEQMIVRPLPLIVCLFHAVTCLLVWLTEKGRNLVRETQGKHICYWSAVSLVVNQLFQILLFKYTITERLSIQSAILFVAGSVIGMHTFHHLGASFLFLMVCKSLFVAWWIFFLSITRLSYAALLVLLGCLVIHHSFGVLTENEFFASFDRLKSASMSTWELVEDTVYAAGMIDDAITRCRVVIHPQLKTQLKTIVNQNYDESIAALNRTLVDELHRLPVFDQKHAILAESEYLCRALRFALKNDPEMLPRLRDERGGRNSSSSAYAQFTFLEACTTVISMLEFAVGHGLPIYVDDNAQKVNITGPQSILEVILLLLLYDCAHNTPGICILSCDSNAGEGWKLKVQTTTLHKRATGKYSPQPLDAVQRRAPRLISQGWLLAKSLLDAQSSEKRSCLERLADHISRKSLQEPVLETEPEYREGYKISYRSIALKNDVFSCAPTFGKPGAVTARLNSSSSLGSNGSNPRPMTTPSTEEEALMEEREQLPPPLLSSSSTLQEPERIHIDSWVFLVPRQQDANDLSDLKSKIDILALPTMGNISLPDLNKQNYSFSCGIISESYLKALGKQQCNVILRKIKQLVVAFDHKINSAEYFSFEYGVKGVETLPLHGSSLKQVFDCVQKVATKQGPRLVPGSPQQFASVRDYMTQWIGLLTTFKDLDKLSSRGADCMVSHINTAAEKMHLVNGHTVYTAICSMDTHCSYSQNSRRYLHSMDRILGKLRNALDKDHDPAAAEGFLSDALQQSTDVLPVHDMLKTMQSVMNLCMGVYKGNERNSTSGFATPLSPRTLVDISEPAVHSVLRSMVDLIDACIWEVVLNKD